MSGRVLVLNLVCQNYYREKNNGFDDLFSMSNFIVEPLIKTCASKVNCGFISYKIQFFEKRCSYLHQEDSPKFGSESQGQRTKGNRGNRKYSKCVPYITKYLSNLKIDGNRPLILIFSVFIYSQNLIFFKTAFRPTVHMYIQLLLWKIIARSK